MRTLPWVLIAFVLVAFAACQQPTGGGITDPTAMQGTGSIDGEFYIDSPADGSVANIKVAVYKSEVEFRNRQPAIVVETNMQGRYVITGICCGQYFLDAWKDNDGDLSVSSGDHYLAHKDSDGNPCRHTVDECADTFGGKLEVVR